MYISINITSLLQCVSISYIYALFLSTELRAFGRDHFSRLTRDEKSFNATAWYQSESVLTPTPISTDVY